MFHGPEVFALRLQDGGDRQVKRKHFLTRRRTGLGVLASTLMVAVAATILALHTGAVRTGGSPASRGGLHATTTAPARVSAVPVPNLPAAQASLPLPVTLPARARPLRLPVLMYHYVDATPPPAGPYAAGLTVPTWKFEAEMNYLASNGYHPVTLEQIYAAMAGVSTLPAKPVALTFDDGGQDDYSVALPILRAHHFVATFFVITGAVGRAGSMGWGELRAMQDEGMAIESHTVHHLDLRALAPARLRDELIQSRDNIGAELGEAPVAFAYPAGEYNPDVIAAVRTAGYLLAVTTHPGEILDPGRVYEWPRIRVVPGESSASFAQALAGAPFAFRTAPAGRPSAKRSPVARPGRPRSPAARSAPGLPVA
jgi:peptidoglycan/xylan/chitin deacetylase (PgdA/CDA1 family)